MLVTSAAAQFEQSGEAEQHSLQSLRQKFPWMRSPLNKKAEWIVSCVFLALSAHQIRRRSLQRSLKKYSVLSLTYELLAQDVMSFLQQVLFVGSVMYLFK